MGSCLIELNGQNGNFGSIEKSASADLSISFRVIEKIGYVKKMECKVTESSCSLSCKYKINTHPIASVSVAAS